MSFYNPHREYHLSLLGPCRSSYTRGQTYPTIQRHSSLYNPLHSFDLAKGDQKHYQQQYGDMYFLRLAKLKPVVEEIAKESWSEIEVSLIQAAKFLESIGLRILDSRRESAPC